MAELGSKADWEEDGGRGEMDAYNVGGESGKGGLGMGGWSGREALACSSRVLGLHLISATDLLCDPGQDPTPPWA